MTKRFRLAVINSHPIQYFAPLFRYVNKDPDIEVTALYCSDFSLRGAIDPGFKQAVTWDVDLLSGYQSVFLGERAKTRVPGGFWSLVCPQAWREVRSGKYDALLIHGYSYAANMVAALAAKSIGIPVFLRSETPKKNAHSPFKHKVRDSVLSFAYRFVDGFFAIGTSNHEYYRQLGVPEHKIFSVPYTVDNERFISAAKIDDAEKKALKAQFNLPNNRPIVLYASKFMRRKHPDDLIRAIHDLKQRGIDAVLFMVGTGEMESELKQLVTELGMSEVVFGGFINQSMLPKVFAICDVFVLPSEREPWGLIVNEAMCAGLPIIASDEIGCVPDLVRHGVNGFHIEVGDVNGLSDALERIVCDSDKTEAMRTSSLSIIGAWSYAQCLTGLHKALENVLIGKVVKI